MRKILLIFMLVSVFISCRKYPDFDELTYKPLVVTNHDNAIDFNGYKTYYMSDSLTQIGDDRNDSIADATLGGPIINAIVTNMNSRGFVRVTSPSLADLGINSAVIKITTTVQTYPPGYYWGYPGYGGGYYGYGGYYPYYDYGYGGYYSYSYTYSTGSLIVEVIDLKNVDSTSTRLNVLWTNFNTGVLGVTGTSVGNAVNSVDQAFIQSPYFKTNQ
jgi:hypothetical protein